MEVTEVEYERDDAHMVCHEQLNDGGSQCVLPLLLRCCCCGRLRLRGSGRVGERLRVAESAAVDGGGLERLVLDLGRLI